MTSVKKYLLAGALSVVSMVASPFAASAEEVVFKMGFADPEGSPYVMGGHKIAEEVARLTDNAIRIEIYPSSQLGNERDMYEGAQIGSIDIATVVNVVMSGFIPEMAVLDQPFLFDTIEQAHKAVDGTLGQLIAEKGRAQGIHIVGWLESGFRNVFTKNPITKLEDFKGVKIRTMENRMQIAAFNALGAVSAPMAYSELFTAIQQGTVDGAENAVGNVLTNRFYEIIKNVTMSNHQYTYIAIIFSDKAWNRIPDALKPKVLEGVKIGVDYQRQLLLDYNAEATVKLKELGVQFHEIDRESLKAVVLPALEPFKASMPKEWLDAVEEAKK